MQLDKAIQSRQSIRKYKEKKPDWRDILECIDASRYAPMAGNNFTLKFILVDDSEKIKKFVDCCQQKHVGQAHYVVIVCTMPDRTVNAYGEEGKRYCAQQAGAAIQNFLLKIQEKGLSTCWTGYFVEKQLKKILDIPNNVIIEAIFPIGYEMGDTRKKRKTELDNILYFNEWDNEKMKNPKKLSA